MGSGLLSSPGVSLVGSSSGFARNLAVDTIQPESHFEKDRCSFCGGARPPNAPRGLCPYCLFQQGLDGSCADGSGPPSDRAAGPIALEPGDSSVLARIAESVVVGQGTRL